MDHGFVGFGVWYLKWILQLGCQVRAFVRIIKARVWGRMNATYITKYIWHHVTCARIHGWNWNSPCIHIHLFNMWIWPHSNLFLAFLLPTIVRIGIFSHFMVRSPNLRHVHLKVIGIHNFVLLNLLKNIPTLINIMYIIWCTNFESRPSIEMKRIVFLYCKLKLHLSLNSKLKKNCF